MKKKTRNQGRRSRGEPRKKRLDLCVLNITLLNHSPERYSALIRDCHRLRVTVPYRGQTHAMIGVLTKTEVEGKRMLLGRVFAFFDISAGTKWLNVKEREQATDEEMQLIEVPEHLKPGFEEYHFLFDPETHRLAFDARLKPTNGERIFNRMLNAPELAGTYGDVVVTLTQSHDVLEQIFAMPQLRSLTIHLVRPNPDSLAEVAAEIWERLQRNHAESVEETYKARSGESLDPDEKTKKLAQVALDNGFVAAHGTDADGRTKDESTKNHPARHSFTYEADDARTFLDVFRDSGFAVLGRRVKRRKSHE